MKVYCISSCSTAWSKKNVRQVFVKIVVNVLFLRRTAININRNSMKYFESQIEEFANIIVKYCYNN